MCGRYTLAKTIEDIEELVGDIESDIPLAPRYNIAPQQPILTLFNERKPRLGISQWGLVPHWATDPTMGSRLINARSETVAEKPTFRSALKNQRCLIFADGFFEWKKEPNQKLKTPMYIRLKSGALFAFAGLYAHWQGADGSELTTATILTTAPNTLVYTIHHRMPVILRREAIDTWLNPDVYDPAALTPLLTRYPAEEMEAYPVSRLVNNVRHDGPDCIEPAAPPPPAPVQGELF